MLWFMLPQVCTSTPPNARPMRSRYGAMNSSVTAGETTASRSSLTHTPYRLSIHRYGMQWQGDRFPSLTANIFWI